MILRASTEPVRGLREHSGADGAALRRNPQARPIADRWSKLFRPSGPSSMQVVSHPKAQQELGAVALWCDQQQPGLVCSGFDTIGGSSMLKPCQTFETFEYR